MNDRKCIVTGQSGDADAMIRFVAGPDDQIVPDIKRNLPGRGCWVTATRSMVERAVEKQAFSRALKRKVSVDTSLPSLVDQLLEKSALGALGLSRKAGAALIGAMQVEKAVRAGKVAGVLHAKEGAADGVRKITQARRATVHLGGPNVPAFIMFSQTQMDLAFGGINVIHAAVMDTGPGLAALKRLKALHTYRELVEDTLVSADETDWDEQETDEE